MLKQKVEFQITLRAARTNAGLSAEEASKLLGINKDTLLRRERDSIGCSMNFLQEVSDLYGVPINLFFLGKQSHLFRTKKGYNEINPN